MQTIVIYPGRFEPPHLGHRASYQQLQKQFPNASVIIATSGVVAPVTHPFKFGDKVDLFNKLGIPAASVVLTKNPYQVQEITQNVSDPANTVLIFAVSAKDMGENPRFKFGVKKDGSASYMQPYPKDGKGLKPMTEHAYVYTTQVATFKVMGRDANSASEIRNLYIKGNQHDREQIIHDLYGVTDPAIQDLFDRRLGLAEKTRDTVIKQAPIDANVMDTPAPLKRESREKLAQLLESITLMEHRAAAAYRPFEEDLMANYICEATGKKYY